MKKKTDGTERSQQHLKKHQEQLVNSSFKAVVGYIWELKLKRFLKTVNSRFFKIHRSSSMAFIMSNVGEFFWG